MASCPTVRRVEWGDNLNPSYYVQMLITASQAIKRVDPNIMVISAGLAPTRWNDWGTAIDDLEYMRRIGSDAAYYADCIGAHFSTLHRRRWRLAPPSSNW